MPTNITTRLGDCMASLAQSHGFADHKKVYDDGANADLKSRRPNPDVLVEGDAVVIPDAEALVVKDLPTGDVHKIVLPHVDTLLRIKVVDGKGVAIAGLDYELKVGAAAFTGTLPGDGQIEHPIDAVETAGTLALWVKKEPGVDGIVLPLEIGSLEHESVNRACQARLLNLGYDCGGVGGTVDAPTRDALRAFQKAAPVPVNGNLDAATREALRKAHEGE